MFNIAQSVIPNKVFDAFSKSSYEIKSGVLFISSALSVVGLASSFFMSNPTLLTYSTILGVTNAIAYLDLGSSEKLRGYAKSFKAAGVLEHQEGVTIEELNKLLTKLKEHETSSSKDLEEILAQNNTLKEQLGNSLKTIEDLRESESDSQKKICTLEGLILKNRQELEKIASSRSEESKEIEKDKKSMIEAASLISQLSDQIDLLTRENKKLKRDVENLTDQLSVKKRL